MKITISEHRSEWSRRFEAEKRELLALGFPDGTQILHVGSTSVPGLGAKDIVDIMVGLVDFSVADSLVTKITALGYEYVPEFERKMPFRRFFRMKGNPRGDFNVHVVGLGSEFWDELVLFRDFLREHPNEAAAYEAMKRELARREWKTSSDYAEAKSTFIEAAKDRARAARTK